MADSEKRNDPAGEGTREAQARPEGGVRFGIRLKFSLAIITLVSIIILSITMFFIWRESDLLKTQIMQSVEREIVHLANTTQQSIGVDELSMIAAINDLKKIDYIRYAFVLDRNDLIVHYFDRRGAREPAIPLEDGVDRDLAERAGNADIRIVEVREAGNPRGRIYDFSRTVLNKIDKRKIGSVIIGLSNSVIIDEIDRLLMIIVPVAFLFLLISIVGSIVLASVIIRPIRSLSRGAEIIGGGNLDHRIDIVSRDELGQLAREFNQMTAQIKEAREREIETRIMDEQIEMAKEIQEGLNPTGFYNEGGVQIKGYSKAARGVGGDYFDYIDIDADRVGALISDVSGKGIPASLVMVMIRTVFTSFKTRKDVECAKVVRAINDSLSAEFAIDKFATLFFMIYDRASEHLSFSNAGHGPLFCYRASTGSCTLSKLEGMPIGIDEDSEYRQARVRLERGDIVVLYTDGVTEMRSEKGEEYGMRRLNDLIVGNSRLNAEEMVDLIVEDLERFRGQEPPHDDTTLLVLKRVS
ncbi:MAG: SpoIIE family protein phosphatase [Spirochaetes bacterium]|nr:SpoIIE family protein phosphatase [Spirochaetota bacterium]